MPPPKNNLEEVLSIHAKGGSMQQVPVNPPTKKPKFKPSLSNASAGPSSSSTSLPTFSTPGFGKPKTTTQPKNATALKSSTINNRREIVDISSESTSSSPTGSVKRTSSDPSLDAPPIQAAKRVKSNSVAEKENLANRPPRSPHKHVSITAPVGHQLTEDEPWRNMVSDPEPNPFKRLTRDFPQYDRPPSTIRSIPAPAPPPTTVPGQIVSEHDAKLMKKSASDLQKYQLMNHEISEFISDLAFKSQRDESMAIDMDLVDQIRTLVRDRNASIKRVIALKESVPSMPAHCQPTETFSPQSPYFADNSSTALAVGRSISEDRVIPEQPLTNTQSVASSRTISEPIEIDDDDDDYDNYAQNPASDDLWAHMDDVPMDIEHRTTTTVTTKTVHSAVNTQPTTPLDREVMKALQSVFKLTSFRHNQREAIVAALAGQDVFVLMPTGGGKSLCYQLPAVCKLGTTHGVTLVVSPLISLMKDQVQALQEKRVDVLLWNAETSPSEARNRMLAEATPSLVYVTPEKLKESNQAQNVINTLYSRKQLARFVIDEAHCISTWGQDFREAYQGLSSLRERYPDVPIMALTATATKNTIADIRMQLKLDNKCAFFKQSFNRPNLRYVIEPKKNNTLVDQMIEFITAAHPNKSGVIYCLSRKDCESTSKKLVDKGLKAHYYHAGMPTKEKDETLSNWQKGRIHIIVATIAFGMGIDKPDVRFVLHHCMPKSLDGYYQETGRAGRDGEPADCILYFSIGDYCKIVRMIKGSGSNGLPPSPEAVDRQLTALRTVVSYCNNVTECRRVQVLAHFDEQFNRKNCGLTIPGAKCDNCSSEAPISIEDVTEEANHALDLIESMESQNERVTLIMCRDTLRGQGKKHAAQPQHGKASRLSPELVDQMLQTLLVMDVLKVEPLDNGTGFNTDYIFVGSAANEFRDEEMEVKIGWRQKPGTTGVKKPRQKKPKKGKEKHQPATEFDPIETFQDDLDDFGESDPSSGSMSQASATNHASSSSHKLPETPAPAHKPASNSSGDSASILYSEMRKLREEITRTEHLRSEDDVFDDATLQYLSVTCPLDYQSFIEGLAIVAADRMLETEATLHAQTQYLRYGSRFMSLCQDHKSSSRLVSTTFL